MAKNKVDLVPTEKAPQGIIINQISVNRVVRQLLDMGKWKTALQSAEMDRWTLLYDLYEGILTDGRLWDAVERRIRAVTSSDLTFQLADGTEVQEIIDLIDTDDFEYLLHEILMAIFQRVSLIQLDFSDGLQVFSVPRKHIRPLTKTVAVMQNDIDGSISYESLQNIVEVLDRKDKYGLLLRAAPYVIMMRGGISDWAQMVELFGMPQRIGKYSIYDQEARKQLEQAFKEQGAAASMVVPKETDVEMADNGRSTNSSIYKDFMSELKEAMLVTVLSNTMTTLDGSSRSQSEVHQDVEDEVNKQDMRFVQRILNKKVKPILEARGFKVHGGSFVFPKALKDLTVDELVSLSDIIEIPAYYFQKKFGIPEAKGTDVIARKAASPAPVSPTDVPPTDVPPVDIPPVPDKSPKSPPSPNDPLKKGDKRSGGVKPTAKLSDTENKFIRGIVDFFANARTLGSRANLNEKSNNNITTNIKMSPSEGDEREARRGSELDLSDTININDLIKRAIRELYDDEEKRNELINKNLFDVTNNKLQAGIDTSLKTVDDSEFVDRFKNNTAVFAAFKNHLQTKEIVALLTDENGKLRSFSQFKKLALQVSEKYDGRWLQTEYNQAVRSARIAANLKGYEKTLHLYPNLEYVESTAANERESHLKYVGTILPFNHPWWDDHMPPSDWNCQCSVKQSDKDPTDVPDGDYVDPQFQNNPAETASFVNIEDNSYYTNTDESVRNDVMLDAAKLLEQYLSSKKNTGK